MASSFTSVVGSYLEGHRMFAQAIVNTHDAESSTGQVSGGFI